MQAPTSAINQIVALTTKAAESFVTAYYDAMDSAEPQRTRSVAQLYSPTCRIAWNGNPIPYSDLETFLTRLPKSIHEVQAFDCHPIPGSSNGTAPPSVIVAVTGQVTHGDQPAPSATSAGSKDFEFLPRVFSQSFILAFDPRVAQQDDQPHYAIASDAFRFVG